MEYRHELKFQVSPMDLVKIKYRLSNFMAPDEHQGDDGYVIRSLYFDDRFDSALNENLAGVDTRQKFRIRTYNGSSTRINLEKKSKRAGMTKKEGFLLTEEECRQYMEGTVSAMLPQMQAKHLLPACIVEYNRYALVEPTGNVRITFDTDLRGSSDVAGFLDPDLVMTPISMGEGQILEVKYDEFLPKWILQAVDLNHLQQQSFSKYSVVRQGLRGMRL